MSIENFSVIFVIIISIGLVFTVILNFKFIVYKIMITYFKFGFSKGDVIDDIFAKKIDEVFPKEMIKENDLMYILSEIESLVSERTSLHMFYAKSLKDIDASVSRLSILMLPLIHEFTTAMKSYLILLIKDHGVISKDYNFEGFINRVELLIFLKSYFDPEYFSFDMDLKIDINFSVVKNDEELRKINKLFEILSDEKINTENKLKNYYNTLNDHWLLYKVHFFYVLSSNYHKLPL